MVPRFPEFSITLYTTEVQLFGLGSKPLYLFLRLGTYNLFLDYPASNPPSLL